MGANICSQASDADANDVQDNVERAEKATPGNTNVTMNNSFDKSAIKQNFKNLDSNHDGQLSLNEFMMTWTLLGLTPNDKHTIMEMFEHFDERQEGHISLKEFEKFVENLHGKQVQELEYHWGYDSHNGPDTWGANGYPDACKNNQSPINIELPHVIRKNERSPTITVHYKDCDAIVMNNGHTVQWAVTDAGYILIDNERFNLCQFHYHCKSEHTFSGQQYPIEFHFVHAHHQTGRLAVLGYLFKAGQQDSKFIETITHLPAPQPDEKAEMRLSQDQLTYFMQGEYVHYDGSLTTPPCSENVLWFVNKHVQTISHPEVAWFRCCIKHDTFRPVLPLNDRVLTTACIVAN